MRPKQKRRLEVHCFDIRRVKRFAKLFEHVADQPPRRPEHQEREQRADDSCEAEQDQGDLRVAPIDVHDNHDAEDEQKDQGALLFALVNDDDDSEDDENNDDDCEVEQRDQGAPLVALESC